MKKYLFVLLALVLFAFSGCKKFAGNPISKDFTIGSYTDLQVDDAFEVTVSDAVDVVTVTVGERVMPKVVVQVEENTLKIYIEGINYSNFGADMKAVIPYNAELTCVRLSGAAEFHSEYGLEGERVDVLMTGASEFYCDIDADKIKMDLSGGSDVKGYVEALDLDIEMSGASDATLKGQVATLEMNLSGASEIKETVNGTRYRFACDQCEGSMSGGSDAYIHCDGNIKVSLSGGSELHFTGSAFTADSSTSGGSEIIHDVLP